MKKLTRDLARQLAPKVQGLEWDDARGVLDQLTAGDLDCTQLDLLTDWALQIETPKD